MALFPSAFSLLKPPAPTLSSVRFLTNGDQFPVSTRLSIRTLDFRESSLTIRMGGGPRTYPGGVSKWQWKRMQAKKAKQLLKARLCRERQIYEMRKRTELKAAISELEKPWEVVDKAPNLFSVKADEQVKVLADRFQKPGGFDMWSEKDGPQILRPYDGLPSARFFPKGVVHSVKPYGIVADTSVSSRLDNSSDEDDLQFDDWIARGKGGIRRVSSSSHRDRSRSDDKGVYDKTEGLSRTLVANRSSNAGSRGTEVPRLADSGSDIETEGGRYLTDQRQVDFFKAGKPSNLNFRGPGYRHPTRDSNEANATKQRKFSGREGHKNFNRIHVSSPDGRLRNNRDGQRSYERSDGSRVDTLRIGRAEIVKMKDSGQDIVANHGFMEGRNLLQQKNSQRSDAYRRRVFNWSEDDNFGNSR